MQYSHTNRHITALKRIVRYLLKTSERALLYYWFRAWKNGVKKKIDGDIYKRFIKEHIQKYQR